MEAEERPALAGRMVAAALRDLDAQGAALASQELQSSSASAGRPLAELGLSLARRSGDPRRLYRWSEWSRAGIFRLVPVTPPSEPEQQRLLGELRSRGADARIGRDGADAAGLRRRGRLERELRRRAMFDQRRQYRPQTPISAAELVDGLGNRQLLSWVLVDDQLMALTARDGRFRKVQLGPSAPILSLLRQLERARKVEDVDADGLVGQLDEALLRPLAKHVRDDPVILVPPLELLATPWAELPGLRDRPFVIAPSATLWARAHERVVVAPPAARQRVLAVAGPRLVHAEDDVRRVAEHRTGATLLLGPDATVAATVAALERADVVHIAAHGEFRPDNPLLSSIVLFDGPLMAHDLEGAGRLPPIWILASCEIGRLSPRRSSEILGMASVLLQFGAASVVAATGLIPDEAMPRFSGELHRHLADGQEPAAALASLRRNADGDRLGRDATAFVSLGAF
jgi:hypothetical protein